MLSYVSEFSKQLDSRFSDKLESITSSSRIKKFAEKEFICLRVALELDTEMGLTVSSQKVFENALKQVTSSLKVNKKRRAAIVKGARLGFYGPRD